MMGTPSRLSWLTSPNNSSEAPLFESRIATSRRPTMPRSPCNESTGWRNDAGVPVEVNVARSEEHTSELQSRLHLVCRLLLEKKKKQNRKPAATTPPSSRPLTGSSTRTPYEHDSLHRP